MNQLSNIGKIIEKTKDGSVLKSILSLITKTGEHGTPEFCAYCGQEKSEFRYPDNAFIWKTGNREDVSGRIVLLDCECEKRLKMLKMFLDVNAVWLVNPESRNKDIPSYDGPGGGEFYKELHQEAVRKVKSDYDAMLFWRDKNRNTHKVEELVR